MQASGVWRPAEASPEPQTVTDLLRAAGGYIQLALPDGWAVSFSVTARRPRDMDGTLTIESKGAFSQTYRVVAKRTLARREALTLTHVNPTTGPDGAGPLLLVARYIAPPLQDELRGLGVSYADATGNFFLYSTDPLILVSERGAHADPWRGPGRPVGTLKGLPAALMVRALADYSPPFSVPDLAQASGASIGAAYRLVDFLTDQGLLDRAERGPITDVRWRQLLTRWSEEYRFLDSNTTEGFLEPRGLDQLVAKLQRGTTQRYAVTGSLAARPYAPYAEPRLAMVYVDDITGFANDLALRPVDTGANVILASPRSPVVYERTAATDGVTIVAPSQAAVDLLTGPGRNPSEGDMLLNWMERNPDEWRRQLDR